MDEIKEKFLELLEFYPISYGVNVKKTPYTELDNIVITDPQAKKHHIFLPSKEDPYRFELSAALALLGERHHLLSTNYFSRDTREFFAEFVEPFEKLVRIVRFGWAGKVAAKHSPDAERLLSESLKRIEIEYLNALYRESKRAALEVLPYIAFAKGLDADWDFFNHEGLNLLVNDLISSEISLENLLRFAEKFSKYLPCFCGFEVVEDPDRGFEVFNLKL
jgi:hypothetical protein